MRIDTRLRRTFYRSLALVAVALTAALLAGCPGEETITDPPVVVVSAVAPSSGALTGGARVTVYGAEFYTGAIVRFGDNYGADVQIVSDGELTVLTPPGLAAGAVDVTVSSPDHAAGTLAGGYTYVSWWNGAWAARVPVTVTGSASGALTDFQVRVVLPFDGDMRPDFTDLRFTVWDGTTEVSVPFWREYATPGVEGAFWVRIPSLPASPATITVYAYYGNDTAPDGSNFDATFDKEYGDTGLLGLWHMDEGYGDWTADGSGNGNHGALLGFDLPFGWVGHDGGGWDGRTGVRFTVGDCLHFDGETGVVDAGAFPSLGGAAAFSVEAWVRGDTATAGGGAQTIASQWAPRDAGFADSANWEAFNASALPVSAYGGYRGSVFDGRHVYFVPYYYGSYHGQFLRYDTHGSFSASGSWQAYDYGQALESANRWEQKTALSSARESLRCAAVNGKVYAMGGYNGGALTNCDEYDPSGNSWTARAPLPVAKYDFGIAVVNNLIYCIGGAGPVATVHIYDPTANTWSAGTAMPTARSLTGCAVWNGLVYVIGGDDGTGPVDTVEIYDPASDSWTAGPDMPSPRARLGCAAYGDRIFAIGGYNTATRNTVEALNPVSGVWTTRASMPYERQDFAIGVIENHIFVNSGLDNGGGFRTETFEYDPETDVWRQRTSEWYWARDRVGGCVLNDTLYVVGGRTWGPQAREDVDIYSPTRDYYVYGTDVRYDLDGFSTGIFDGRYIYFIPYYNHSFHHGTLVRFDTQGGFTDFTSWTHFDPGLWGVGADADGYLGACFDGRYIYMSPYDRGGALSGIVLRFDTQGEFKSVSSYATFDPSAYGLGTNPTRGFHGAVYDGRHVYFVPYNNGVVYSGEIVRYDTQAAFAEPASWEVYDAAPSTTYGWYARTTMPSPRHWATSATVGNRIYVTGGTNGTSYNYQTALEEYNPLTDTWRGRASYPLPRVEPTAAALDGKIYVHGGHWDPDGGLPAPDMTWPELYIYNTGTNTWSAGAAGPAMAAHCAEAVNGKVYFIGGLTGNPPTAPVNWVREYDPATNSWRNRSSMPAPRYRAASCTYDGKIHVIGGTDGTIRSNHYLYDPVNDSWTTLASLPQPMNAMHAVVIGKRIIVCGGSGSAATNTVYMYDTDQNLWYTAVPMNFGRYAHTLGVAQGKIYALGGWNGANMGNVDCYDPAVPRGFIRGLFDGKHVYFTSYYPGTTPVLGGVLRYDIRKDFHDHQSYTSVCAQLMGANFYDGSTWHNTGRLQGGGFDGRFIYFTQYYRDTPSGFHTGQVARYDTEAAFDDPAAWRGYNPFYDGVMTNNVCFHGHAFDGRYLYCVPYRTDPGSYPGEVCRYDTAGDGSVFKLLWQPPDPCHGMTGAPVGPQATILTAGGTFTASANRRIEAGGWHHVAATYDGSTLSLYIDGLLAGSSPATGALNTSSVPLFFGNQAGANARFKGQMDEARVYDRALAANEVKAHSERRKYADPEPAVGSPGTEEHK